MESATTVTMVLAGLFFSLVCALLMEELVFGGLFWFFFGDRAGRKSKADASTSLTLGVVMTTNEA